MLSRQYFGGSDPRTQGVFETMDGAKAWAAEEDVGATLSWHLSFGKTSARGGNDHVWDIEEMELLP